VPGRFRSLGWDPVAREHHHHQHQHTGLGSIERAARATGGSRRHGARPKRGAGGARDGWERGTNERATQGRVRGGRRLQQRAE
jgi:hypothetical protein